jgi:hypothetical protein
MRATVAAQKPAVLTSLRPAATLRRRTLIIQSPVQPPALLAANMTRYGSVLTAPSVARSACSTCSTGKE